MKLKYLIPLFWAAAALTACSSGGENTGTGTEDTGTEEPADKKLPISINASLEGPTETRVTDTSFESGDAIGIYVATYNADGTAPALLAQGNYVDNMKYTYNGTWTPASPVYWPDDSTPADFYAYSPYTSPVTDVNAMPFNTNADQSTEAAYRAGDLLIGSAKNVKPTEQAVQIKTRHAMSQMVIDVEPGNGFTQESLAEADVAVKVYGVKTQATVNIAQASVTATGTAASVTPLYDGSVYRAIIVPQDVSEGNLITITIDGRDYNLKKAFTFAGGTRHKFTVTPNKTSSGVNVTIESWVDDGTDNGGTAE